MSTITKIELALELAEKVMRERSYEHGVCLGVSLQQGTSDIWHVEFAYSGLDDRSETTDPPSIVLEVNLSSEKVQSVELM